MMDQEVGSVERFFMSPFLFFPSTSSILLFPEHCSKWSSLSLVEREEIESDKEGERSRKEGLEEGRKGVKKGGREEEGKKKPSCVVGLTIQFHFDMC